MTPLDKAHAGMTAAAKGGSAAGGGDRARIAYWHVLAMTELFLLLDAEPAGDVVRPRLIETDDGPLVLAYDTPDRLVAAMGAGAFHLAISGRDLARMLAGQGVSLGINLGLGRADFLASPEALDWLATADLPGVDPAPDPRLT